MDDDRQYIDALIALHSGLARQGPGGETFAERLLDELPKLPARPRKDERPESRLGASCIRQTRSVR